MANVLKMAKKHAIIGLLESGWSYRASAGALRSLTKGLSIHPEKLQLPDAFDLHHCFESSSRTGVYCLWIRKNGKRPVDQPVRGQKDE